MYGTAIVRGKVVRFRLPEALARAHQRNSGQTMTSEEAIVFVEAKRRELVSDPIAGNHLNMEGSAETMGLAVPFSRLKATFLFLLTWS